MLVGFVPGRTGAARRALLADEGIALRGVDVGGELRSTAVVLERSGRVTVFNEPGPALAPEDWVRYEGVGRGRAGRRGRGAARARVQRVAAAGRAGRRLRAAGRGRARARRRGRRRRGRRAARGGRGRRCRRGDARTWPRPRACSTVAPTRPSTPGTSPRCASGRSPPPGRSSSAARRGRWSRRPRRARRSPTAGWRAGSPRPSCPRCATRSGPAMRWWAGCRWRWGRARTFAAAVALGMACGAASVETDVAGVVVPARVAALLSAGA